MTANRRPHLFEILRDRMRPPLLVLVSAPLLLLTAACGASQAASDQDAAGPMSATAEKNGVQMSISPASGPVGTPVEVRLSGVRPNTFAPYGVVSLRDASGAFGEDELTSDYVLDTRTAGAGGTMQISYHIPAHVLVKAAPDAQNPTARSATAVGAGAIVFAYAEAELEVPFTVVDGATPLDAPDAAGVRRVVAALLSGDESALSPLVGLTKKACTGSAVDAASGQPICEPGVAPGTDVPFVPERVTGVCRTAVRLRAIQSSELGDLARSLVPDDATNVYAVYRSAGTDTYAIILVRAANEDGYGVLGTVVTVEGGKLTSMRRHCGDVGDDANTLRELVKGVAPSDFLVGPPQD